jgi:hypothetical protein
MVTGKYIRLTKLAAASNPTALTPEWENFVPGQDNGLVSLPLDYTAEGYLTSDIKVGMHFFMNRIKRNGVEAIGKFASSPVKKITGNQVETQNSIYIVEELPQN